MVNKRGRIIVVDDNAHWREELAEVLAEKEFSVVAVANKEMALKQLAEEEFDLVILDVNLADASDNFDGLILNQKIQRDYENLPVILISARSLTEKELEEIKPAVFLSKSDVWENLETYLSFFDLGDSERANNR